MNDEEKWERDPNNAGNEAVLPLVRTGYGQINAEACVKWDDCIHFRKFYNGGRGVGGADDQDYMHLCGTAETVDDMLSIAEWAEKTLGGEWSGERAALDKVLAKHGYIRRSG